MNVETAAPPEDTADLIWAELVTLARKAIDLAAPAAPLHESHSDIIGEGHQPAFIVAEQFSRSTMIATARAARSQAKLAPPQPDAAEFGEAVARQP